MTPIRFNKEVDIRQEKVVDRLKDIRTLQVSYKSEFGQYTGSWDSLITFYKEGSINLIRQFGSLDDSAAVARGEVYRDTIKMPVKDTLFVNKGNFNIDSLEYVPGTGVPFEMEAKIYTTISKVRVPLFEARTPNDVWLSGLNRQLIVNKNDTEEKEKRYPGLKVGSVESPNNNAGNWKTE
jgi:hypothetical protein